MTHCLEVDVIVEDLRWTKALDLGALADRAATATVIRLGLEGAFEAALLAADDARIRDLNAAFRDKPVATNVLSWPSEPRQAEVPGAVPEPPVSDPSGMPVFLGDIALAFDICDAEALAAKKSFEDHTTHLIVHAILHLLGYDHETDADAHLMEGLEVAILAQLGIGSPYE